MSEVFGSKRIKTNSREINQSALLKNNTESHNTNNGIGSYGCSGHSPKRDFYTTLKERSTEFIFSTESDTNNSVLDNHTQTCGCSKSFSI